jgi:hypothetical protein
LALDYLLASEGGVCGKFNLSNCCWQIDDKGNIIEEITDWMKKLAHVPIQTWRGWNSMTCLEDGSLPWADSKPWWGRWVLGVCLMSSWFPSIAVYQDHYGGHYRKENSCTCNDAIEIQTSRSRWCSLTPGGSEHQRGE